MQKSKREHLVVTESNSIIHYHTIPGSFVKYYNTAKVMIDGLWCDVDQSFEYSNAFYNVKVKYTVS